MLLSVQVIRGSVSHFNDKGWSSFSRVAMAVKNVYKCEILN